MELCTRSIYVYDGLAMTRTSIASLASGPKLAFWYEQNNIANANANQVCLVKSQTQTLTLTQALGVHEPLRYETNV